MDLKIGSSVADYFPIKTHRPRIETDGITCISDLSKMTRLYALLEFIPLFLLNNVLVLCNLNEIRLPQGKINGLRSYSNNYRAYLGIPYASVTERFKGPGPPPKWNRTLQAVRGSIKCMQIDRDSQEPVGQEDCLVLNVFTPFISRRKLLPVLIFVHGGGFYSGSNSDLEYNPKHLLKKDIIVVTINYRLGAFGFLCLPTTEAPGNAGLKDQVAALRWVRSNIKYFGGDPQLISLYGQSVGASSISYLILSNETEGLFQNVILSSGSLLVPYALDNDPIGSASRIASRMGYVTDDPNKLLKIYQNASAEDIVMASNIDDKNDPIAPYIFRPCIDKSKGSLVPGKPREIIKSTLIERNISIVIGYNNREGIKWAEKFELQGLENLNNDFSSIFPYNIIFTSKEEKAEFVAEVKEFYFNNDTIGPNSYDPLINYLSDSIIMYPLTAMTIYFLRSNISVYNYYFQYDSNRNLHKRRTTLASKPGVCHGDDLNYVFESLLYRVFPPLLNDTLVIDAMASFWKNFAKTGNPTSKKMNWIPSQKNKQKFLSIDKNIEIIPLPNRERLLFWKAIYEKYKSF